MKARRLNTVQEYYFSKKLRAVAAMVAEGKPVINMGIGSPDLPAHPKVVTALKDSFDHPKVHQYQSYQGLPELRQAIADFYHKHYKYIADPNSEILPLMGSKEGIMHISMAFLNPGDKALIPNPGYPTYQSVTRLVEAEPVFYDLKAEHQWQPDLEALDQMDLTNVKLMWVNYPHMPTGANVQKDTFEKLIAWAKEKDILLVNDNPYSFVLTDQPQSLMSVPGAQEVGMELNSLSKSFNMAGWRVGMVLGNKENINAVLKVKSNMDSGMFYGIQQGAIAALQAQESWFKNLNDIYRKRRKLIFELASLLNTDFDPHSSGLFVWAKMRETSKSSVEYIEEILQNHHIFIAPGSIFGSQGEGYVRFSLCVEEEQISKAIERIRKA
ncbi:MAG: aminotransferase class I/II-fold pyridoxal phosphate-dependent enzyme [Flavobacteriaceae bacterium]|jgi:aspartate/methionine/tyrosine aminotransferase|nr:aminotransferase class I/II-fold pyridoxal phosphate-dependent enzyme [Flavobacteriaceae bacterium]MDG1028409.1 aminotransferase class I/II-fold pyridoxal phosphate-dependent enzyme [Flavobacteriaceae bacterium]|tara:strand:+ start:141 stop:1289 length:1149 start_codon:yes stop_codon:yes gene_type:complete